MKKTIFSKNVISIETEYVSFSLDVGSTLLCVVIGSIIYRGVML